MLSTLFISLLILSLTFRSHTLHPPSSHEHMLKEPTHSPQTSATPMSPYHSHPLFGSTSPWKRCNAGYIRVTCLHTPAKHRITHLPPTPPHTLPIPPERPMYRDERASHAHTVPPPTHPRTHTHLDGVRGSGEHSMTGVHINYVSPS